MATASGRSQGTDTPSPEAEPLSWVPLPPPYPLTPTRLQAQPPKTRLVPRQYPPEVHLLNPWAQAEEIGQQEEAVCGQSCLAQPVEERGRALCEQVRARQDQWVRNMDGEDWWVSKAIRKGKPTQERQSGAWGQGDLCLSPSSACWLGVLEGTT